MGVVTIFKSSRPYQARRLPVGTFEGTPLPLSGQVAETFYVRDTGGHHSAGVYNARCDGKGRVDLRRWAVQRVIREQPGHIDVEVLPGDGGLSIQILESDPVDPIRNLQVWMSGFQGAGSPFHPLFQNGPNRPVIHFTDWQRTNDSSLTSRQARPRVSDARYPIEKGIARRVDGRVARPAFAGPRRVRQRGLIPEFGRTHAGRKNGPGARARATLSAYSPTRDDRSRSSRPVPGSSAVTSAWCA
jgi:hypothetical protein